MLQISTRKLESRKHVEIDGHAYVVRKLGAGEQLTVNQIMRESAKLQKKLESNTLTEEEEVRLEQLSSEMIAIFSGLFDDGGDGSKSKALIQSLNENEIKELFVQIFPQANNDTPQTS